MTTPHEPTDETLDAMHACTIGGAPSRDQWRAVYRVAVEAYAAELRRVLGARPEEMAIDAARRVVDQLDIARGDIEAMRHTVKNMATEAAGQRANVEQLLAERDKARATADGVREILSAYEHETAQDAALRVVQEEARRYHEARELRRERDEAHHTIKNMATEANARRVEAESMRRERDDARAEVERLRKLFDDAGHGEHNVLALVEHYQAEAREAAEQRDAARAEVAGNATAELHCEIDQLRAALRLAESTRDAAQAIATRETERRREVEGWLDHASDSLDACHDEAIDAIRGEMAARAEADALRELAWSWCITARDEHLRAALEQTRAQRAIREAEVPEHASEPIESLGPVPILPNGLRALCNEPESLLDQVVGWLIRDAVRRGAKLEGE